MSTELSPEVVNHLEDNLLPHLSEKQEAEFRFLVSRYKRSWDHMQNLQNYINEQTQILRVSLDRALTDYQQIENKITLTKTWISPNPKLDWSIARLPIIIGRIKVKLSNPKLNLPFPIRWLKRFALNEHPALAPLTEDKLAKESEIDNNRQEYSQNLTKFHEDKKEDLDSVNNNLQISGSFVLTFCDELSAQSLTAAEKYIRVIPSQAEKVVRDYVEKNITSDHVLNHFPSFINHIHSLLIDDAAKRVAKRRYGHWLNETTTPTYDQLLQLSPAVQRRFKEFVIYSKTCDWTKQGLINQPQLPDILISP